MPELPLDDNERDALVGHLDRVRFAPGTQRIVGLTVISARQVLDRDGRLIVTAPETVDATAEDLAPAL